MAKEYARSERVASQVQRELSKLLLEYKGDLELGFVTISEVTLTRDLSVATIYITLLGIEADERKVKMSNIAEAAVFFRRELGRNMRLRVVPELRFVYDDSIDNGMQMEKLLKDLKD